MIANQSLCPYAKAANLHFVKVKNFESVGNNASETLEIHFVINVIVINIL